MIKKSAREKSQGANTRASKKNFISRERKSCSPELKIKEEIESISDDDTDQMLKIIATKSKKKHFLDDALKRIDLRKTKKD